MSALAKATAETEANHIEDFALETETQMVDLTAVAKATTEKN